MTSPTAGAATAGSAASRAERVRALAAAALAPGAGRGPVLPVLRAIATDFGSIQRPDVQVVADVLNVSVAEVHGVVSFYHDLRTTPAPAHVVRVCRGEACQSVGGQQLHDQARAALACRADVEVGEVFCLGNCALGPAVLVDDRLHGRMTLSRLASLLTPDGA